MTKKYRLEIPEDLKPVLPPHCIIMDGEEVFPICYNGDYCEIVVEKHKEISAYVKISWLKEIKLPMTAEEWHATYKEGRAQKAKDDTWDYFDMEQAFEAGEENERLKHEPELPFGEWIEEMPWYDSDGKRLEVETIVKAWDKNRGFDE